MFGLSNPISFPELQALNHFGSTNLISFSDLQTLFHFRTNEPYFIFGLTNLRTKELFFIFVLEYTCFWCIENPTIDNVVFIIVTIFYHVFLYTAVPENPKSAGSSRLQGTAKIHLAKPTWRIPDRLLRRGDKFSHTGRSGLWPLCPFCPGCWR